MNLMKVMTPAMLAFAIVACGNTQRTNPSNNASTTTTAVASQTLDQTQAAGATASGSGIVYVSPTLTQPTATTSGANATPAADTAPANTASGANANTPAVGPGAAVACVGSSTDTCTILGHTSYTLINQAGVVLTSSVAATDATHPVAVGAALVSDSDGSILAQQAGLLTSQGLRIEFAPEVPLVDSNGTLAVAYTLYAWTLDANNMAQVFKQPLEALIVTGNGAPAATWQISPVNMRATLTATVDMALMASAPRLPAQVDQAIDATSLGFVLCELSLPGAGPGSSAMSISPRSMRIIDAATGLEVFNDIASPQLAPNGFCSRSIELPHLLHAGGNYTVEIFSMQGDNMYLASGGTAIADFVPLRLYNVSGATVVYIFEADGTPSLLAN